MENLLIFVKCITLLYRESTLDKGADGSGEMVRKILGQVKLPEISITLDDERGQLMNLRATALSMCDASPDQPVDKNDLLQRIKVNCTTNNRIYEALKDGIEPELDQASTKRMVLSIRRSLKESAREKEVLDLLKKAHSDTSFERTKIKSIKGYVAELMRKLEPFQVDGSEVKDPAIVGEVDLAKPDSLTAAFTEMQNVENEHGMLRTGWQALNFMLQGGFRPGEQWVIPALQHKWKSGFTLSLFKQLAIYNTPSLIDPAKKPLLLRITLEDSLANNVRFLYENIYFNEKGDMPDIKLVPVQEMAHRVKTTLESTGFHVKMIQVNPSLWTYQDLQNFCIGLEAEGYEIKLCMIDYLPMIPTTGCEEGPMGHALQDLYRRTRNFFVGRRAVCITPHQLSTDAKQLVREGTADFVKQLPGKGYYRGSKQIDQEVDGELYLHIEKMNGAAFLTLQRGKHRGVPVIPDEKQYVVYQFPAVGPISDDIDKPRIDLKRVGGRQGGGEADDPNAFFDFNA
jgi:hypothetical protein